MSEFTESKDDAIDRAVALAQYVATEINTVLLTHYPDRDTLDTFRPSAADFDTVTATNRAVATTLAAMGVEILVQRADRAAFRRWMQKRHDTAEVRRSWIDRAKLLQGDAALGLLGIDPPKTRPAERYSAAPGPIADRLINAFNDDIDETFEDLANGLIGAGRDDVLQLAIRKLGERDGDEAADTLEADLLATAASGRFGPAGWAELVALPVALPSRELPDAAASIAASFIACGFLEDSAEIRFLPGWRSPAALAELSPVTLRRVLHDLVAGAEPKDLPPADTDDLARDGFGLLLGLQIDWDIPIWDQIVANGPDHAPGDDEPEEARRAQLLDAWRVKMFDAHHGCVPLALVAATEAGAEIADFLEEAAEHAGAIDEIRAFIAMVRREANGEEIVGHATVDDERLELALYTHSGRFMDSLTLARDRIPATPDEMADLLASLVRVVKHPPGRQPPPQAPAR